VCGDARQLCRRRILKRQGRRGSQCLGGMPLVIGWLLEPKSVFRQTRPLTLTMSCWNTKAVDLDVPQLTSNFVQATRPLATLCRQRHRRAWHRGAGSSIINSDLRCLRRRVRDTRNDGQKSWPGSTAYEDCRAKTPTKTGAALPLPGCSGRNADGMAAQLRITSSASSLRRLFCLMASICLRNPPAVAHSISYR